MSFFCFFFAKKLQLVTTIQMRHMNSHIFFSDRLSETGNQISAFFFIRHICHPLVLNPLSAWTILHVWILSTFSKMAENNSKCFVSSIVLLETGNEFFANDLALSLVNAVSACFALLSNLVIAVVMKKKQLIKTPCHTLILSLTLVDCVAALVVRPLYIALRLVLHEDHVTCYSLQRLARSTDTAIVLFTGCSFMHMICIARDRFKALSRPVEYQSSREMKGKLRTEMGPQRFWWFSFKC